MLFLSKILCAFKIAYTLKKIKWRSIMVCVYAEHTEYAWKEWYPAKKLFLFYKRMRYEKLSLFSLDVSLQKTGAWMKAAHFCWQSCWII